MWLVDPSSIFLSSFLCEGVRCVVQPPRACGREVRELSSGDSVLLARSELGAGQFRFCIQWVPESDC